MSYTTHKVWCAIEGRGDVFKVVVSSDEDIGDLRDKITQQINRGRHDINPIDLVLWKPKEIVPIKPIESFVERIRNLVQDPLQFAERLNPAHSVDAVFQFHTVTFPQLSVFVDFPASDHYTSRQQHLGDSVTPMELTPSWDSLRNEQVNLIKTAAIGDSDQIEDLNILLKGLLRV